MHKLRYPCVYTQWRMAMFSRGSRKCSVIFALTWGKNIISSNPSIPLMFSALTASPKPGARGYPAKAVQNKTEQTLFHEVMPEVVVTTCCGCQEYKWVMKQSGRFMGKRCLQQGFGFYGCGILFEDQHLVGWDGSHLTKWDKCFSAGRIADLVRRPLNKEWWGEDRVSSSRICKWPDAELLEVCIGHRWVQDGWLFRKAI